MVTPLNDRHRHRRTPRRRLVIDAIHFAIHCCGYPLRTFKEIISSPEFASVYSCSHLSLHCALRCPQLTNSLTATGRQRARVRAKCQRVLELLQRTEYLILLLFIFAPCPVASFGGRPGLFRFQHRSHFGDVRVVWRLGTRQARIFSFQLHLTFGKRRRWWCSVNVTPTRTFSLMMFSCI